MRKSTYSLPERPESPPPPRAAIPFSRDPHFVNRGDILDQISQRCSEPPGRVALVGLGGVGKTQLAIEYAHRVTDRTAEGQPGTWVFSVFAATKARLEEGFKTIADAVKLPGRNQSQADIPQLVYNWLSNDRNGRWVIILDNADDRNVLYSPISDDTPNSRPFATYLPQNRNGSILITTRNKDLAFRLTGYHQNIIEVGPMAQTDALTLLENKLGSLPDPDVAVDLVHALDLVPLAISQAAAYIRERAPRTSPSKYLADFRASEKRQTKLLEHDAGDLRRDGGAPNAILTTWQISFEHIRSERPSAADLLSLMSFFDRQGIPGWVLSPSGTCNQTMRQAGDSTDSNSTTDGDSDSDADNDFEEDVVMLRNYCLIVADETGDNFEMHRLVQLSTKRWLEAFGQHETFKQRCIERLAASFPPTGEYENWATCRSLFAHVQVAASYLPSDDMTEVWAALLCRGGWYAQQQGRYDVAERMVGEAREVHERKLGKENEVTLVILSNLASVVSSRERWNEAVKLQAEAVELSKRKLGVDHLDTLANMKNLAFVFKNQGRLEEAEQLQLQVLEIEKAKLGVDHPRIATTINNLASIFWNQGRLEEAEELQVQVTELRKAQLGVDHPDTLLSMSSLAATFYSQGRLEEAEQLEVQVIELRKAKLGVDHPDTLLSMGILASIFSEQGRLEEAEQLQLQVLESEKAKLGVDHPGVVTTMNNLASIFWKQGRWEEAEQLEVQVIEFRKVKLGVDHPSTLSSMGNLALTWRSQGRYQDALALMMDCAEARQRVLGATHADTVLSLATVTEWRGSNDTCIKRVSRRAGIVGRMRQLFVWRPKKR
ncbi:P-loop containing nucleoside triphosphate hydrolase protein [Chaetomium tenue]|uniref:P-loop containing nucleoside triphosphate hydrolase protein n=1 Tax=Chaetomium tenue TaxID=1854479 RepID=A0ACB7PLA3_9PEZI|nr:P-loop containing nucleoside triphosphate hydrolase protein [Chaetomium globosum]